MPARLPMHACLQGAGVACPHVLDELVGRNQDRMADGSQVSDVLRWRVACGYVGHVADGLQVCFVLRWRANCGCSRRRCSQDCENYLAEGLQVCISAEAAGCSCS